VPECSAVASCICSQSLSDSLLRRSCTAGVLRCFTAVLSLSDDKVAFDFFSSERDVISTNQKQSPCERFFVDRSVCMRGVVLNALCWI
jgi:hypothetical protein